MESRFKAQYDQYLSCVESYLNDQCFVEDAPQKALFEAMRYSLLAGGKRLRPIFVLDFCQMCGYFFYAKWLLSQSMNKINRCSRIQQCCLRHKFLLC